MTDGGLVKLSYWLSPAFPVGAFAYSHGLEQAIAGDDVIGRESLFDWLAFLVTRGGPFNDAVLFGAAMKAADDPAQLEAITDFALALCSSKERLQEQLDMGRAFAEAIALTEPLPDGITGSRAAYPIVAGAMAGKAGALIVPATRLFLQAFCANLTGVGQRLIPLGQTDGVRVMSRLEPIIAASAERAERTPIADIGGAALMSDIAAMKHETLKVRIFRT